MKKILLLTSFLWLTLVPLAQSQVLIGLLFGDKLNNDRIEFGFNVSANLSTIDGLAQAKRKGDLGFGLFLDIKLSEKWIASPSFFFVSRKGARDFAVSDQLYPLPDTLQGSYDSQRTLQYFELPVMINYRFAKKFGIGLGFDLAYLNVARDYYVGDTENGTISVTHNIRGDVKHLDFGLVAGLHYHFKGNPGAQIRLNYIYGITNIFRDKNSRKGYNRTLQMGVMIPIKFGMGKGKDEEE